MLLHARNFRYQLSCRHARFVQSVGTTCANVRSDIELYPVLWTVQTALHFNLQICLFQSHLLREVATLIVVLHGKKLLRRTRWPVPAGQQLLLDARSHSCPRWLLKNSREHSVDP